MISQVIFLQKIIFFTLGGHDRDGGTTNGSGDSKQTSSTRDRGDSIIGVYWWQTMYGEKITEAQFEKIKIFIYEYASKNIMVINTVCSIIICFCYISIEIQIEI